MSTFYLFDMHVPTIANSRIVDVVMTTTPTGSFRCDGLTPVKVPEGVRVVNPTSLTDLLTQKYAGIFAQYPGFTHILTDDLLDPSGIDATGSDPVYLKKSGSRSTIGGNIRTLAATAATTITQCILVTEHYTWKYVDSRDGRIERYYIEEPEIFHTSSISVDNGTHFTSTTSGSLVTFSGPDQGTQVMIEFLSTSPSNVFLNGRLVHTGSWAVIY